MLVQTLFALLVVSALSAADYSNWTKVNDLFLDAIRDRIFPGGSITVANETHTLYRKNFGTLSYTYQLHDVEVKNETKYDIASVTKVMATTLGMMSLAGSNLIKVTDLVSRYIPNYDINKKGNTTLANLLMHNSGLRYDYPGALPRTTDEVWEYITYAKPDFAVGTQFQYSNLGFQLLSKIVANVSRKTFEAYFEQNKIFAGLKNTNFNPPQSEWYKIAPTEYDAEIRKRIVRGEVHERLAYFFGGVGGHSGLFTDADDLTRYMRILVSGGKIPGEFSRILSEAVVSQFTTKVEGLPYSNHMGYGFGTGCPSSKMSNCFGHDGSTGVMAWADKDKKIVFVIMNNRGHPDAGNNKINAWKPKIATAIMEALGYRPHHSIDTTTHQSPLLYSHPHFIANYQSTTYHFSIRFKLLPSLFSFTGGSVFASDSFSSLSNFSCIQICFPSCSTRFSTAVTRWSLTFPVLSYSMSCWLEAILPLRRASSFRCSEGLRLPAAMAWLIWLPSSLTLPFRLWASLRCCSCSWLSLLLCWYFCSLMAEWWLSSARFWLTLSLMASISFMIWNSMLLLLLVRWQKLALILAMMSALPWLRSGWSRSILLLRLRQYWMSPIWLSSQNYIMVYCVLCAFISRIICSFSEMCCSSRSQQTWYSFSSRLNSWNLSNVLSLITSKIASKASNDLGCSSANSRCIYSWQLRMQKLQADWYRSSITLTQRSSMLSSYLLLRYVSMYLTTFAMMFPFSTNSLYRFSVARPQTSRKIWAVRRMYSSLMHLVSRKGRWIRSALLPTYPFSNASGSISVAQNGTILSPSTALAYEVRCKLKNIFGMKTQEFCLWLLPLLLPRWIWLGVIFSTTSLSTWSSSSIDCFLLLS